MGQNALKIFGGVKRVNSKLECLEARRREDQKAGRLGGKNLRDAVSQVGLSVYGIFGTLVIKSTA
jgi:hypothetical protein